jgi:hypothetical protein
VRQSRDRVFSLSFLCLLLAGLSQGQTSPQPKAQTPKDSTHFVSLKDVVTVVETVLNVVQNHLKAENSPLLQSAEFDFQTVTTNDTAGGLIVSIITAEGEHMRETTREIDFIYSLPETAPHNIEENFHGLDWLTSLFQDLRKTTKPGDFNKTLPAAIVAAADTMTVVRSIDSPGGNLSQRQFVITLLFSVTNAFNGGVDPSSLIVVAPEVKYLRSSQNVQTLKLTFADQ